MRRALAGVLAVALLVPVLTATAVAASPAAQLALARERIDEASAELARARSAAEGGGPEAQRELARVESRLQARKQTLIELERRLSARSERAERRQAQEEPEVVDETADDGPVVVLGEDQQAGAGAPGPAPAVRGGGPSAVAIDGYLASKASPLTGLGALFVAESRAAGLDPRFLVAVAGAETGFGTYGPSQAIRNPFGMGPGIEYDSWEEAIGAAARNLAGGYYAGEGRFTIAAIGPRWAPRGAANDPGDLNHNWSRNVATYYAELGGDPALPVFNARAIAAARVDPLDAPVDAALPVIAPPVVIGASGMSRAAAEEALATLGAPSVARGAGPRDGFDAAGLIVWAYERAGVELPGTLSALAEAGVATAPQELVAGDAIFFSRPSGEIVHAGLYLGDGQFVHAPGPGDIVRISTLYDPGFAEAFAGARHY